MKYLNNVISAICKLFTKKPTTSINANNNSQVNTGNISGHQHTGHTAQFAFGDNTTNIHNQENHIYTDNSNYATYRIEKISPTNTIARYSLTNKLLFLVFIILALPLLATFLHASSALYQFNMYLIVPLILIYSLLTYRGNKLSALKKVGFTFSAITRKLYVNEDGIIYWAQVIGECPMLGCKHQLNFCKLFPNKENHEYCIKCNNSPSHFYRFNLSGIGERITVTLKPQDKIKIN